MGTATSQNGVDGPLPKDRPKVYLCSDCGNGNEFTKFALEAHKRKCSHHVSCACIVCSFKPPLKQYKKNSKTCSLISRVSFKATDLSETRGIAGTGNSVKVSEMVKKIQSALTDKPKIESSRSTKNSPSAYLHSNQIQELHITSVSTVVSETKCTSRKLSEDSDSGGNDPDHKPCDRKINCIICKMHIFWESFGTHVLQHSIKRENSVFVCPLCSQSCSLPNHYLMHFFGHTSDHDCQECHCGNSRCPCCAQIPTTCCYICLKSFTDVYAVMSHMMTHT